MRFMPCPVCGDICGCSSGARSAAPGEQRTPEDSLAWRQEVALRLNRYQARRKPRPPRYPSLLLPFDTHEVNYRQENNSLEATPFPLTRRTVSNQALAFDEFAECVPEAPVEHLDVQANPGPAALPTASQPVAPPTPSAVHSTATATAKIIEFPRSWTPPPPPLDQLAEPVTDRPRILEAPEIVPPPPALGGITIEPAPHSPPAKRPGIDVPLQSASLARRIFSAAIDALIVLMACASFAAIFWDLTAIRPPRLQITALAAGLFFVFWFAYQSLLVIYAGSTPGLRLMRLEISRFNGNSAGRRLRRWRVLASFLSVLSLGMGYVWVFLDEDSLCWHDRITHTHLAQRPRRDATPALGAPSSISRS